MKATSSPSFEPPAESCCIRISFTSVPESSLAVKVVSGAHAINIARRIGTNLILAIETFADSPSSAQAVRIRAERFRARQGQVRHCCPRRRLSSTLHQQALERVPEK